MTEVTLKVFYSSVSGNLEMKKNQQTIFDILDGKKIPYQLVDISQKTEDKDLMRELVGNKTALPPQICNGAKHCGDYKAFYTANEEGTLLDFLKLK